MSLIRSLYNKSRQIVRKEETKETGFAALTGFALGYMGHGGKMDHNGIPLDSLGGLALMYGHMIPVVNKLPLFGSWDKRTREIGSAAIAVGMARIGDKAAGGGGILPRKLASHHGDAFGRDRGYMAEGLNGSPAAFGKASAFGAESSLVRAARKL